MTGIHFSSNSEEIRYYEKQLLEDGMVHTREELFAYAKTQSANGGRFTEGMLSGATRDLVRNSNGLYFSPARGKYQKAICKIGAAAGESLQPIMIDYLENMCQGLENIFLSGIRWIRQKKFGNELWTFQIRISRS